MPSRSTAYRAVGRGLPTTKVMAALLLPRGRRSCPRPHGAVLADPPASHHDAFPSRRLPLPTRAGATKSERDPRPEATRNAGPPRRSGGGGPRPPPSCSRGERCGPRGRCGGAAAQLGSGGAGRFSEAPESGAIRPVTPPCRPAGQVWFDSAWYARHGSPRSVPQAGKVDVAGRLRRC